MFRYIVFNVPVHANATLEVVGHWFSVYTILSQVNTNVLHQAQTFFGCVTIPHLHVTPIDKDTIWTNELAPSTGGPATAGELLTLSCNGLLKMRD